MHELGLTDAMLKMVDKIKAKENISCVRTITVEIGDLSGVVPSFLENCWSAVTFGTDYEETVLKIMTVPGTLRCEDCGKVFVANLDDLSCTECSSRKLTPITGRDMTIQEIEAY